jgi:hypothetical protein
MSYALTKKQGGCVKDARSSEGFELRGALDWVRLDSTVKGYYYDHTMGKAIVVSRISGLDAID